MTPDHDQHKITVKNTRNVFREGLVARDLLCHIFMYLWWLEG